jgi:hypothetical protein
MFTGTMNKIIMTNRILCSSFFVTRGRSLQVVNECLKTFATGIFIYKGNNG